MHRSLSPVTVTRRQAVGKYEEAGDHAIRCYDYYLQHSGSEDTDVLTRLGNLQVSFSHYYFFGVYNCGPEGMSVCLRCSAA